MHTRCKLVAFSASAAAAACSIISQLIFLLKISLKNAAQRRRPANAETEEMTEAGAEAEAETRREAEATTAETA